MMRDAVGLLQSIHPYQQPVVIMKKHTSILLAALHLTAAPTQLNAQGGSLAPPQGAPGPTMRSLQEIWDKLDGVETQLKAAALRDFTRSYTDGGFAWDMSIANTIPQTGNSISLAIAPNGTINVAHGNFTAESLNVATNSGAAWTSQVVPNTTPHFAGICSAAIGPDGHPAVSYYDFSAGAGRLSIARFNGSTWTTGMVDNSGGQPTGYMSSIAFGPNGHPVVAYSATLGNQIRLARFNGTTWAIETIASSVGSTMTMKLDKNGNPVLVYWGMGFDNATLHISRWNGSSWIHGTVLNNLPPSFLSLAITPDNRPVVAFTSGAAPRLASFNGVGWILSDPIQTPNSFVGRESLDVGPDGQPAILHVDSNLKLWFSRHTAGTWKTTFVDGLVTNDYAALEFASDGRPVVAYGSGLSNQLVVADMHLPEVP
jgi:hypothetical protein